MFFKPKLGSWKNRLLQQAAGSFGLRLIYTALTFVTNILLARFLGTEDFGIYNYTVTWSYLLAVFGTIGLDNLLVREVAIYCSQSAWGLLRGILRWADRLSLIFSLSLSAIAIGIGFFVVDMESNSAMFISFVSAIASLPFASLRNLRRGIMRGLDRVTIGFIPEMLIAPLAILISAIAAYWILQERLTAAWLVGLYTVITAITLIISAMLVNRYLPSKIATVNPQFESQKWLHSALPFMFLEGIYVINARVDVLMLGALQNVEAAGIYVPVNRGAQLINFVLMAVCSALAPIIARLYAEGKSKQLEATVIKTARVALIPACLLTALLIIFSDRYLLIFGKEFVRGQTALSILCVGQLIFTATGLAGLLLNMTGKERYTAITGTISAGVNIILNYLLISRWGVSGAAMATSISVVVMNLINIILVRQKLGIASTALKI
jgi:O-antigen/teichoic acid export membrane protein